MSQWALAFKGQSSFKKEIDEPFRIVYVSRQPLTYRRFQSIRVCAVSAVFIQSVTEKQTEVLCQMSYYLQITKSLQSTPCVHMLFYLNKWDLPKTLSASPQCLGWWISKDFSSWQFCKGTKTDLFLYFTIKGTRIDT